MGKMTTYKGTDTRLITS